MKRRDFVLGAAGIGGTLGALTLSPIKASAAKGGGGGGHELAAPVTGHFTNTATGEVLQFAGTLTVERFVNSGGQILAIGSVAGNLLNLAGQIIDTIVQAVELLTTISQGTCNVLTLVLGPLHLELLGLIVDLNQVVLTITADPTGGLLGQLLCALAGATLIDQIVALLNQLLGLFGSV
jgi:hypothetical protein